MKRNNTLLKMTVSITKEQLLNDECCVKNSLEGVEYCYSYVIYSVFDKDELTGWTLRLHLSQDDVYNTIYLEEEYDNITSILLSHLKTQEREDIIGYKQAPLELLVLYLEPLVKSLATEQMKYWPIEFEDLCQICKLSMCKLYRKNYYIHKSILRQTFIRDVLMHLRKDRYKPLQISIDEPVAFDEDNNALRLSDTLVDVDAMNAMEDAEDEIVKNQVNDALKQLIIDVIGQRQYDQLLREYGNKSTTPWSRKTVQTLKNRFKRLGIDRNLFRRYY